MIALVFPFRAELEGFARGMPGGLVAASTDAGPALWKSPHHPDWLLSVSGQGKVEAALTCQQVHALARVREYWLLGAAAALDPALQVGDFLLADRCIEWDFGEAETVKGKPGFDYEMQKHGATGAAWRRGAVLSGDRNVFDPEQKQGLGRRYGARALAWEGAGFARFLRRNHVPGRELRLITETAREAFPGPKEFRSRLRKYLQQGREIVLSHYRS